MSLLIGTETEYAGELPSYTAMYWFRFQATDTGISNIMRIYGTHLGVLKMALYSDSAGEPDARLYYDNFGHYIDAGWNNLTFESSVTSGTYYWIGLFLAVYTWDNWTPVAKIGVNSTGGTSRYKALTGDFNNQNWPATAYADLTSGTLLPSVNIQFDSTCILFDHAQGVSVGANVEINHVSGGGVEYYQEWSQLIIPTQDISLNHIKIRNSGVLTSNDNIFRVGIKEVDADNYRSGNHLCYATVTANSLQPWSNLRKFDMGDYQLLKGHKYAISGDFYSGEDYETFPTDPSPATTYWMKTNLSAYPTGYVSYTQRNLATGDNWTDYTEYALVFELWGNISVIDSINLTDAISINCEGSSRSIDKYVVASTDDATTIYGTTISLTSLASPLGNNSGVVYGDGMRFLDITIPTGSTIVTAYIVFTCKNATTADTVRVKLSAEQNNNAATFSTYADFAGRTLTTAQVDWDFTTDWVVDSEYNSADIKSIIQELVNDYSGLSNANIVIFANNDGSDNNANRQAYSYDGSTTKCTKLHIEYTLPSTYYRFLSDTFEITVTNTFSLIKTAIADSLSIIGVAGRKTLKNLTESFSMAGTISKLFSLFVESTVTIVDSIIKSTKKYYLSTIELIEAFRWAVEGWYFKVLSDTIDIVDSLKKSITQTSRKESITLIDTAPKLIRRTLSENSTLSDSILRRIFKSINNTVTLIETASKSTQKVLLNSVSVLGTWFNQTKIIITESISFIESLGRLIRKPVSNTVSLVETLIKKAVKVISNTISIVASSVREITAEESTSGISGLFIDDFILQSNTLTTDSVGGHTDDYTQVTKTFRGQLSRASGSEGLSSGKTTGYASHILYCAHMDVTERDRVIFGDRTFLVTGVKEPSNADEHLEIDLLEI